MWEAIRSNYFTGLSEPSESSLEKSFGISFYPYTVCWFARRLQQCNL